MNSSWSIWCHQLYQTKWCLKTFQTHSLYSFWNYLILKTQENETISKQYCTEFTASICHSDHTLDFRLWICYFTLHMRRKSITDWLSCWRYWARLLAGTHHHWRKSISSLLRMCWYHSTKCVAYKTSTHSYWHAWRTTWRKINPSALTWWPVC